MYLEKMNANIWKYTVLLVTNKRTYIAILGAYYLTIPDVTAQSIGLILLIGNMAGFLFEIPSGYVSDKLGHKQAIVVAYLFFILSSFFFLISNSLTLLILGSISLSVASAFFSGTGSAFMHETLRALNREEDYAKVMGKASSIGFAVPIVLTVLTPFLVSISYKVPFALSIVLDVIGLIFALSLTTPQVTPEHVAEVNTTNFKQVMQAGYKLGFFRYAIFSAFVGAVLFSIGIFRAPYQVFLEIPVIWFGVLFGAGRALASLILAYSGLIKNYFPNIVLFYRFKIIFYTILLLLLAVSVNAWFVAGVLLVINGFQWGLSQVSRGFILEIIRESKFKATLLSTEAQISNIFNGIICFVLGIVIEQTSYQIAFFVLGICFLLTTLPLYFYIRKK